MIIIGTDAEQNWEVRPEVQNREPENTEKHGSETHTHTQMNETLPWDNETKGLNREINHSLKT